MMPANDTDLEKQKEGLKIEIDDMTKTHEKQVCFFTFFFIGNAFIGIIGERNRCQTKHVDHCSKRT